MKKASITLIGIAVVTTALILQVKYSLFENWSLHFAFLGMEKKLSQSHKGVENKHSSQKKSIDSITKTRAAAFHNVTKQTFSCELGAETLTLPIAPHFIVIGAEKGGTTALMHLLPKHPNVIVSSIPEPHFFDNKRAPMQGDDLNVPEPHFLQLSNGVRRAVSDITPEELCQVRRKMSQGWDSQHLQGAIDAGKQVFAFEKCPSYLMHDSVPQWVDALCPWKPKIIASLRNPMDRAYSNYNMRLRRIAGDANASRAFPSFDAIVSSDVEQLRKYALTTAPSLEQFDPSVHDDSHFALPSNLTLDMRMNVPIGIKLLTISKGFYAQQLRPWMHYFPLGSSLMVIDFDELNAKEGMTLNRIFDFVGASPMPEAGNWTTPAKNKHGIALSNRTRQYLRRFYRPYNDELADLLGEEWRRMWA